MDDEEKKPSGCGLLLLYNNVFHRQQPSSPGHSTNPSPSQPPPPPKVSSPSNSRRRCAASNEPDNCPKVAAPPAQPPRTTPMQAAGPGRGRARAPAHTHARPYNNNTGSGGGISAELDSMIYDHQSTKGSSTLVRASSGNVMLYGNLGNLRAPGAVTSSRNVLDYLPKTANEMKGDVANNKNIQTATNSYTDNEPAETGVMCRALSRRMDPEELKEMGNEEYKNGNFAEAAALYDQAILMDPQKAVYWSNKAAALTGMGKLIEAVTECREAVRVDPNYYRAHLRLGTLYLRLGEAERSLHHYKLSRNEASAADISRAQAVQAHFSKCREARRVKDWHSVLKEMELSISSGADSSPQVFAFKAEALLMLRRHEEAEKVLNGSPKFDMEASTKFFGALKNAFVLMVQAQVDLAAGRFEDALSVANKAARLDTSSREAGSIAKKARLVAAARAAGNDLFKASRFEEACAAYGEGLSHDSNNAVLMCNRAACLSKLGQWEKAIEDCNTALDLRPSYGKARLRRADCNVKLERWEASIKDYEILLCENPNDEDTATALRDAQARLKKHRGEGTKVPDYVSDVPSIMTREQFRHIVSSSGLSVALFYRQSSDDSKKMVALMEQLCRQYPTVNFLKVNVEDSLGISEPEGVSTVPSFRIYKNGSDIREIVGSDSDKLESYLKKCNA